MKITFLFLYLIIVSSVFAQSIDKSESSIDFEKMRNTHREIKTQNRNRRKAKIEAWRQKPWHIYVGFDLMLSHRLAAVKLINTPSYFHNRYQANTAEGTGCGRLYLGVIIKQKNHVELGFENFNHELVFDIYNTKGTYPYFSFGDKQSHLLISASYKRDIFPKSKILKLYPGAFVGLLLNGNVGLLDNYVFAPIIIDNDTINMSRENYYRTAPTFVFGPTLDADINFWHFTIGLKFRMYYNPFVLRGQTMKIYHNSDPVVNAKIESNILNFNWGIGLRYTF